MDELLQQLVNGLSWGTIYALIAIGYTMVYGVLRLINFAHGDVYMFGAMVAYYLATWLKMPFGGTIGTAGGFLLLLVAAMVASALLGFLIEFLAYRPLRNQPRINALITAIGVSLLLQYGGQRIFGPSPKNFKSEWVPVLLPGTETQPRTAYSSGQTTVEYIGSAVRIWWTDAKTTPPPATSPATTSPAANTAVTQPATAPSSSQGADSAVAKSSFQLAKESGVKVYEINIEARLLLMLVLTLILMLVLRHVVLHTRTGLALRAVSHRFDTAALMGINVNRVVSFAFVLGSSLAGAAGVLVVTSYPSVTPLMGATVGLKAFVAAVLGGIGSIPGAVMGGFLLGMVETLVTAYLPGGSQYKDAIAFAILILVLLAKPSGLMGRVVAEKV